MPDYIKFPLVLLIVGLVSASSLSGLKKITDPARKKTEAERFDKTLKSLMPAAESFEKEKEYVVAKDKDGNVLGYISTGKGKGYADNVVVMAAVDPHLKIVATSILSQKETPGLGDAIGRPEFQKQLSGKSHPLKLKADGGELDAITGATISSRAFVDAVNNALEIIMKSLQR